MPLSRREALGEKLVEMGLLTTAQLDLAVREQARMREPLPRVLRNLRFAAEGDIANATAALLNLRRITLDGAKVPESIFATLSRDFLLKAACTPVRLQGNTLEIAMADPFDVETADLIQQKTGRSIRIGVSTESEIHAFLTRQFGVREAISGAIEERINRAVEATQAGGGRVATVDEGSEAPIVELVDVILLQGIHEGATDIHVEPEEKLVRVRYRIDGILQPGCVCPKELQSALLSRLKIMANMDISERRIPQDGRIQYTHDGGVVDMRVSSLPSHFGENIVLRLLQKSAGFFDLSGLGFPPEMMKSLEKIMSCPYGIFLVTGPTGSGKSTTLYSSLSLVNSMEKKVVTIEDPIEYQIPLVRQCQVNPQVGFTFAAGLRSILRQDPDVIMVGEIRDLETAQIAIRAGLTGHLVLSTLHTNSAIGSFPRLIDMGVEPFLLTSSILGVLAQRLVRRVCVKCRIEAGPPSREELDFARASLTSPDVMLYRGTGCASCRGTGYKGRLGIYELYIASEDEKELILKRAPESNLRASTRNRGQRFLMDDGVAKAEKGITTLSEVMRVTQEAVLI
ncbi:MAG: type II/IV secretion system protein [Planctomycetes bacterium]|nr:type II/IV secretion system protein [Planctomycetota bacterium]MBI3847553.1 type II/IV secretion system protein [Planctomycetota bacterium]